MAPGSKHHSTKSEKSAHDIRHSDKKPLNLISRIAGIVSLIDIGVVISDGSGVISYANPAFEAIYEYGAGELIGRSLSEIFPPGSQALKGILNGDGGEHETITVNGKKQKAIVTSSPINDTARIILFNDGTRRGHVDGNPARDEAWNRTLIDAIPDFMFIMKGDGTFLDYKVDGFTRKLLPMDWLIGKNARDVLPKAIAEKFMENVKGTIETGDTRFFEYSITLSGGAHYYEIRCNALGNNEALIIARDFTEWKNAQLRLAEALDLNTKIISTSPVGIIAYNASGECISANEAAANIINSTVPLLLKQNFRELESWRASGMLEAANEVLETGKARHGEFRMMSTFKKDLCLQCHFNLFASGGKSHLLLIFTDISEYNKAYVAQKKYRLLSHNTRDIIFFMQPNGRLIEVNEGAVLAYGYTREELLSKNIRDIKEDNSVSHMNEIMELSENQCILLESIHKRKDGSLFPVEVSYRGATLDNERVLLSVVRDITERKRAEDAIRAKNRDLCILNSIASTINRTMDIKDKMGQVLKDVLDLLNADAGAIYLSEMDKPDEMSLISHEYRTPEGKNVICKPRIPNDIPSENVHYDDGSSNSPGIFENVKASIVVPLVIKDRPVGIMALYSSGAVDQGKTSELLGIGSQLSISIENYSLLKKVKENVKYLSGIISEAPEALITVDKDGWILSLNKNVTRLLKYTAKDLYREKVSALLYKGDLDLTAAKSYVRIFRMKDGTIIQLSVSVSKIDKSDANSGYIITLKDLSEISGLVITPITEKATNTAQIYNLESGTIYLFNRLDGQDYLEILADQVKHNVQGLCVTRQSPKKIRQRLGLDKTPMIWLTGVDSMTGEICMKPNNISGLSATLHKFMSEADNGFILIDGAEYLIARNSFDTFLKFIHYLNDKATISKCSVMIVVDPLSIGEQQYHLLLSEITQFKK